MGRDVIGFAEQFTAEETTGRRISIQPPIRTPGLNNKQVRRHGRHKTKDRDPKTDQQAFHRFHGFFHTDFASSIGDAKNCFTIVSA